MCFGMGLLLTDEEWKLAAPITRPCFAALGLVNDLFSFDIEWEEYQREGKTDQNMTNLVFLFMQWENLSIAEAKERTKETVRHYEEEYYEKVKAFSLDRKTCSTNLETYLKAQSYQISGNVAWSLRCPRYHPELCAKAQDMLDAQLEENEQRPPKNHRPTENIDLYESPESDFFGNSDSEISQQSTTGTPRSSLSSNSSIHSVDEPNDPSKVESSVNLSDQVGCSNVR